LSKSDASLLLKPIETKSASEAIYDQIKDLIIKGELKPGERLPSERNLMGMVKRSRPTIREALRMLERSSLIKTLAGSGGAVVIKPSTMSLMHPLENMIHLNEISVGELLEYRQVNEVYFAGCAAERRTEEELKNILECVRLSSLAPDTDSFIKLDISFHEMIARASHNRFAEVTNNVVNGITIKILQRGLQETFFKEICNTHMELYKAILEQDKNRAMETMRYHINRFADDLKLRC
jgi:GntR family transcriptional repressor for pyruvate dehydrogenase complex